MKKKMMTVLMAVAFALTTVGAVWAAKAVKCEVTAVDGNNVTLKCDDAKSLKKGDPVKVKSAKGRKIEGC